MLALGQSILAQGGVMSLDEFVDQSVGQSALRAGVVENTMSVESWTDDTSQDMANSITGLENAARMVLDSSDPDDIEMGIAATRRKFENELSIYKNRIEQAIRFSTGLNRWVTAGEQTLNPEDARQMLTDYQSRTETMNTILQKAQDKADTIRAQNTANTNLTPQTIKDNRNRLEQTANQYTRRSRTQTGPDAKAMREFVNIQGVLDTIASNAQMFSDFTNDPVGYMKVHKLPDGTVWYDRWKANNP
jgi:hypothetical protein